MKKIAAAAALIVALLMGLAVSASAKTDGAGRTAAILPINYGVADDTGKFADDKGVWFDSELKGANLTENRWTLSWDANEPDTTIDELGFLQKSAPTAQATGIHVVLALYGGKSAVPVASQHDPTHFCTWAANVANTAKQWGIHDFIIWNEENTRLYWVPQETAGADYEALLAMCYDKIHAADSAANVIGFGLSPRASTSQSTEPITFIGQVGTAYKASGRTTRIMDQMAIHPYPDPNNPTDPPSKGYTAPLRYGVPNLDRVKQAVYDAFNGTGQPTTLNGLTFRIDELGWQTNTQPYSQYTGSENVDTVSEQQQADFLKQTVQTYFACDPTVTDVEWFLLVDEGQRSGWQSGMLTAGLQGVSAPKLAYAQLPPLFAAGRSACTGAQINWTPSSGSSSGGSSGNSGGSSGKGGSTGGGTSTPLKKCKKGQKSTKKKPCKKK